MTTFFAATFRIKPMLLLSVILSLTACGGGGGGGESSGGGGSGPTAIDLWTKVSGDPGADINGVCGTQGVAAPGNIPGSRANPATTVDKAGNLWVFGGVGRDCAGATDWGFLNDLWKFDGSQWTFVSGAQARNQSGSKCTSCAPGTPSPLNIPGSRDNTVIWFDDVGTLWMFGGYGYPIGTTSVGFLNDLWKYTNGSWEKVAGSDGINAPGQITLDTQGNLTGYPGARVNMMSWVRSDGSIVITGGSGYNETNVYGELSDVWDLNPKTLSTRAEVWSAAGGNVPVTVNAAPIFGTQNQSNFLNTPGGRHDAMTWTDNAGNFWMFGGYDGANWRNDLWKLNFNGGSWIWTWVGGSQQVNQLGMYGSKGVANSSNWPGARAAAVSWRDANGMAWLSGGWGYSSSGAAFYLNDLWKFDGSNWTWVSGSRLDGAALYDNYSSSNNIGRNCAGCHGALATSTKRGRSFAQIKASIASNAGNLMGQYFAAPDEDIYAIAVALGGETATPSARLNATGSAGTGGKLWLFGGRGYAANGAEGDLNDLWMYQP